jgi:succinoglycan biosynthesis protein ExoA
MENTESQGRSCLVVIPALNEEKHIGICLDTLLRQTAKDFRVVVADGGSVDATRNIVADVAAHEPRISLMDNPGRLQSCAVNLAAARADPDIKTLIRADAHATYPVDFVASLLRVAAETGAQSVVVPMQTVGVTCFQRAVAAAQNSKLGNGGAAHRSGNQASRAVEHGHHALFDLGFFRKIGGYDERFSHNEDFELDYRISKAGGLIWLNAGTMVTYFPRATPISLARQYFKHGRGRARSAVTHAIRLKPRQVLPVVVLLFYVLGLALLPWQPWALVLPLSHFLLSMAWGAVLAAKMRDRCVIASGLAAAIMHISWAVGLCDGLIRYRSTAAS